MDDILGWEVGLDQREIRKAPPNHSNESKEKARRNAARKLGTLYVAILSSTLRSLVARAAGDASPGIDKIALATDDSEMGDWEKDYDKVTPHFGKFGLAKGTHLMTHHKKLHAQPVLHQCRAHAQRARVVRQRSCGQNRGGTPSAPTTC